MQYYFDYILLPHITLRMKVKYAYPIFIFMSHVVMPSLCTFCPPVTDLQYSADAEKMSLLLKAPLYFDLEMYNRAPRLEKVGV